MASDLKTEIFAYNLFRRMWFEGGMVKTTPRFCEIYEDESRGSFDYEEVCDNLFLSLITDVVNVRYQMFKKFYATDFTNEKAESLNSLLDCYEYVNRTCDRDDLFGHLTIFQRMFATLSFVLHFCAWIYNNTLRIDVVKYGYMLWTMYFDKFTEEFYEKGGWGKLKILAYPYVNIYYFCDQFDDENFNYREIIEAIANFNPFTYATDNFVRKYKHLIHTSKLWIKLRIEHFNSYYNAPLSYELSMNAYEAEVLLNDLMVILNSLRYACNDTEISKKERQECSLSTVMPYSKLLHATEEMKANGTGIQRLTLEHENRIIDKVPDKLSNIDSGLEKQVGKKYSISEQDVLTLDITDKIENLEFDKNNLTEIELSKLTTSLDSTKNLYIDQSLLPAVNGNKQSNTSIGYSTNAADSDNSCRSKSFVNKDEDRKIENFCNVNTEEQNKIAITAQGISINKMDENTSPENVPTLKDCSPANGNVSSDDERKKTRKALEDLRHEQKDPAMKNFLKMLLVLDDKGGTQFVLSLLENKEGGAENSHESSKKRKKRSKKKKPGK